MINTFEYARYLCRLAAVKPRRYANLFREIRGNRCRRMLEVGTYDGRHAAQMIQTAGIFHPRDRVEYAGFDLFELLTDDKLNKEFSKRPPDISTVRSRLERTGARISLYQGDTRTILPRVKDDLGQFDLIFIDGGHSEETISSDWNAVKGLMRDGTVVLFDDYYKDPAPELQGIGCRSLVEGLDRDMYEVKVLDPTDEFDKEWGVLKVNFVKVTKKPGGKL